jgi:hypothetical protein
MHLKKRCYACANALQRQRRIIKSGHGINAIIYGSFMHAWPRRATWQAGPLLSDRGAPSVQYDEMSLKLATYRMLFQGSNFSFDAGMLLSALLYASSTAFFFTWSSAFGASCCCLFPFAMAWAGAVAASKVIAIAAITVLILKSFRIWTAC